MNHKNTDSIPDLKWALNQLQAETRLNDTKLATYLGIDRTSIAKFRADLEDLPVHAKVAIYDHLGYFRAQGWFRRILPEKASEKLTAWSQRHADWLARNPKPAENDLAITRSQDSGAVQRFEQDDTFTSSSGLETEAELLKSWFNLIVDLQSMGLTPDAVRLALAPTPKVTEPPPAPVAIATEVNPNNKAWIW